MTFVERHVAAPFGCRHLSLQDGNGLFQFGDGLLGFGNGFLQFLALAGLRFLRFPKPLSPLPPKG